MRTFTAAFLAIWIGLVLSVRGQTAPAPLADRIPGDAMMYVGWAGTDAMSAKYEKSHLKPVMDASSLPQFFSECVPKLIDRVAQDNTEVADVMRELVAIGGPMWKHPTAFYFGGIDFNGPQPLPKVALLCDAGPDAADMSDRIDKLLKEAEKDQSGPFPLVKVYGSMVVLAFGAPADIDAEFAAPPVDPISKAPKFVEAFQQVQKDPAFIEYIDSPQFVKMVDETIQKKADPATSDGWKRARDSLGLTGLHQIIATMGFDGRDWASDGFVGSSDGDQGILSLIHGTPLSQEILKAVPKNADRMAAGKFDLDSFVGHARDVVAQLQPSMGEQVDEVISQINQAAGLDIRKDFLAVLGDEWCTYSDPSIAGSGMLGMVVVNHLRDADAADKALMQLSQRINAIAAQQLQEQKITIEFHEEVIDGLTIHYLAVPLVTPSWAISDGNLYIGLYPQVVCAAADQVKKHAPSILEQPEYLAVMKRLGDHPAGSVEFCNLPVTAPDSYANLLMLSRLYLGGADMLGVHPPAMVIPPLSKIVPELSPCGAISWTDALGLHIRSISPFPGSELIASSDLGSGAKVGAAAILTSVMLPALSRSRDSAKRVASMSNERQLGLALIMYANDHQGKLPDDVGTLLPYVQTPKPFLSPSKPTAVPANFDAMTKDDKAKWIDDNTDYVYLGKGLAVGGMESATHILLYEKDGAHERKGVNLLFGDGHVEFQTTDAAKKMIQNQEGGL